jgi:hypothetical protein
MAVRDVVQAAAGVGGGSEYVEDVFSTYLYTGTGLNGLQIQNGIDLAGEGGMVWVKSRSNGDPHWLVDTERGLNKSLQSNSTNAENTGSDQIISFDSDGFTLGNRNEGQNYNTLNYASWTFRKAPKFFDVVTWTGDGNAGRTIAHNLGSVPGCIIVKSTSNSTNWVTYHRSTGASQSLYLNRTDAAAGNDGWNYTAPTSTEFTVGSYITNNASGYTYVAYLFAHDAGGFGDDGQQNVISCGSYTGNGGTQDINIGFEPQWLLIKNATAASEWSVIDVMRGMIVDSTRDSVNLEANNSNAEANVGRIGPRANGFGFISEGNGELNGNSNTFIYIAIRRPMKTPESGTEVFAPLALNNSTGTVNTTGFPIDLQMQFYRGGGIGYATSQWIDRLRGFSSTTVQSGPLLSTVSTAAEVPTALGTLFNNTGFSTSQNWAGADVAYWNFKRAPGFMDVVCYTGDGVSSREIPHNLGVTPQLAFTKQRSGDANTNWWNFYYPTGQLRTFNDNAFGNGGITASSTWFEGDPSFNNSSTKPFIAYLFASCPGVSKVGTYTGTGANLDVDCGFSAGARFILIKRRDGTGDWYVWDSARGIVSGNDPYLFLNSTAAEEPNTDYIDPLASGFTVTSSAPAALNASGGSYIFLAIA